MDRHSQHEIAFLASGMVGVRHRTVRSKPVFGAHPYLAELPELPVPEANVQLKLQLPEQPLPRISA